MIKINYSTWTKLNFLITIRTQKTLDINICTNRTSIGSTLRSYLHCVDEIHLDRSHSILCHSILQYRYISWVSICILLILFFSDVDNCWDYFYKKFHYKELFFRVQKSAKQLRENYQFTSDDQRQHEVRKASVLIWISIFFIVCQSVKIIPDFYEALYCTHKKVSFDT